MCAPTDKAVPADTLTSLAHHCSTDILLVWFSMHRCLYQSSSLMTPRYLLSSFVCPASRFSLTETCKSSSLKAPIVSHTYLPAIAALRFSNRSMASLSLSSISSAPSQTDRSPQKTHVWLQADR